MDRRRTIGGMTAETYRAENDPSGGIGIALADAIYSERGPDAFRPAEVERVLKGDSNHWSGIAWAALTRFHEQAPGERIHSSEIKRRLREIRTSGCDVPSYSHLNKKESWDLLRKVRMDVRRMANHYCPDVLKEIDAANIRQVESACW